MALTPGERLAVLVRALTAHALLESVQNEIAALGRDAAIPAELETSREHARLQVASADEALLRAIEEGRTPASNHDDPQALCAWHSGDLSEVAITEALLRFLAEP